MRLLRVIETGEASARWNTSASRALLESFDRDPGADILRFYCFRKSVLLGRSQRADKSVDLAYCRRQAIEVARRITGGGAVYMSPTMLAWDFVTRADASHACLSERIGRAVASALASFAVAAEFAAPNDLVVGGRKVSGAAATSLGRAFLHQGTLLLQDDTQQMAAALGIPLTELGARVTSLAECARCVPAGGALQAAIAASLGKAFGSRPVASRLSGQEAERASSELFDEVGLDAPLGAENCAEHGA